MKDNGKMELAMGRENKKILRGMFMKESGRKGRSQGTEKFSIKTNLNSKGFFSKE